MKLATANVHMQQILGVDQLKILVRLIAAPSYAQSQVHENICKQLPM